MSKFITFQVVYFSTGQCQWKITTFEGTLESERESKTFFFLRKSKIYKTLACNNTSSVLSVRVIDQGKNQIKDSFP